MNIYVGNLPYKLEDEELRQLFEQFGKVDTVAIIKDRDSGRSKGFGFVEMENDDEAENAIGELDGSLLKERNIKVNQARPRENKFRSRD